MYRKQKFSMLLAALLLVQLLVVGGAQGAQAIKVVINGKQVSVNPAPILVNGKVLVPARQVLENLGAEVDWDKEAQTVFVEKGYTSIELMIDEDFALVNGAPKDLDVPAQLIKGRTYIPLRFVGQSLGAKVDWDAATWTVNITLEPEKPLEGLAALVRDSVYNSEMANSAEFTLEGQMKIPDIPQLNMVKLDFKKQGETYYATGHALGWPFEGVYHNEMVYLKSILFDNQWLSLKEFGLTDQDIKDFQAEMRLSRQDYEANYKEFLTHIVRQLGTPVGLGEENVNGVATKKIQFKPTKEQLGSLNELVGGPEITEMVPIVWVDAKDSLLYKFDFEVKFYERGQGGFLKIKGDYKSINKPVEITIPDIAKK
ncbi:MAG: stalk domain-containing protein [Clostridia bacterium]|nr:stalk domain-containing protein [Clostridia bacterium]